MFRFGFEYIWSSCSLHEASFKVIRDLKISDGELLKNLQGAPLETLVGSGS